VVVQIHPTLETIAKTFAMPLRNQLKPMFICEFKGKPKLTSPEARRPSGIAAYYSVFSRNTRMVDASARAVIWKALAKAIEISVNSS
jgi:hypothetical protein